MKAEGLRIVKGRASPLRRQRKRALTCSAAIMALAVWSPAMAADDFPSLPRSTFGSVGLIEMPSARMAPDGQIAVGASFFQDTQHYNLDFQALPWLEASFRYSGLQHFYPLFPVYYDRSFAAKVRLFNETEYMPAIAVGINDLVGTGVYGGEYLVASKQFGDFDATLGMGWGRLGSTALFRNPLTLLSDSFKSRPASSDAGGFDLKNFFHGPSSGLFGGLVWHTPVTGLSLIAEYSSDKYALETSRGGFKPADQINLGASYQPSDNLTLGLQWLYGNRIGVSISFLTDPTRPQYPAKLEPPIPPVQARSPQQQQDAVNNLLRRRDGRPDFDPPPPHLTAANRHVDKNGFVDALLRSGDYSDIQSNGRLLVLTVQTDASADTCSRIAGLLPSFGTGFDGIVLHSENASQRPTRCAIPAAQLTANAADTQAQTGIDSPPSNFDVSFPADSDAAARAIRRDAAEQKIDIDGLSVSDGEVILYYVNEYYFSEAEAIGRLVRVLMKDAPARIEKFRLISVKSGVAEKEFDVLRGPMERALAQDNNGSTILDDAITIKAPPLQNPLLGQSDVFPRLSWDIAPTFRQSLFDPDNPLTVQFLAAADASLELRPGLAINGTVEANIWNNFITSRPSDSQLPHVRSDLAKYFSKGATGVAALDTTYNFRLAPDVFAVAKAGYLESMFAGAGGEVLWRPDGQRWALGADLYEVWQRNFDRLFGLQGYRVTTGHVSLYYQSPWYDINFALRAGQYLAGDRGVTFEATRRFATGVEIGAFFTKTNVSAAQFGEGSFDKGIIIRIPLGWVAPITTQSQFSLDLRPVTRDGGQRLDGDTSLYDETRGTSNGEIGQHVGDFTAP